MNLNNVSKTVYSLFYPEVQEVVQKVLSDNSNYQSDYHNAFTKKQDDMHKSFFETYKNWSKNYLSVNWEQFPNMYPCNGSSEAIREELAYLKSTEVEVLYVFESEYEGYEAIASALGFNIIKFNRDDYEKIDFVRDSVLFLSEPSSIDGNFWEQYPFFMAYMEKHNPQVSIYLDLAYLGTVDKEYTIDVKYSNVDGIFFSLSKVFGVYYHRIGGCFLKHSNPLLYGNMWFKNLLSMRIGKELMNSFCPRELPNRYKDVQLKAVHQAALDLGLERMEASDVVLLSHFKNPYPDNHELTRFLSRGDNQNLRACLTPMMEKGIRNNA